MENWLKRGKDENEVVAADSKVREVVEGILRDIAERGDAAVRELSAKFDQCERNDHRLDAREIESCLSQLSHRIGHGEQANIRVRHYGRRHVPDGGVAE